jgi:tRNA(fMet)-specific endonuclease VapC
MYMVDTNTCIFALKNRPAELRQKFKAIRNLCISSITYGELCYGIEKGQPNLREDRWQQLTDFTQRILIDPWDVQAARHYGAIRAALQKQGNIIGNNDLLIAAHARSIECVLVTNNLNEFSRVSDLTVEDWT